MARKVVGNLRKFILIFRQLFWRYKVKNIPDGVYASRLPLKNVFEEYAFENFGAPSKEQHKIWTKQTCGIASLKVITDAVEKSKDKTIYLMAQESREYNCFIVPGIVNEPRDIKGIFHEGLLKYAKSFGFQGFRESLAPFEKVVWYLYKNWLFLASVNIYGIWGDPDEGSDKMHIVLVVGFKKEKGKITEVYYKDSATRLKWRRDTDVVDYEIFRTNFNKRGIFIKA